MSQRVEPSASSDDFPTPPWATRALLKYILQNKVAQNQTCLEPACGAGHMSRVLEEYFSSVESSDKFSYGYGFLRDFLSEEVSDKSFDWVITNPPFRLAEEFILKSLKVSTIGVAVLVRTVFLESVGRYNRLFKNLPPTVFAQFVERVPMVKGRLDFKATTATGYAWLVWSHQNNSSPNVAWIPPCRKSLERHGDYPMLGMKPLLL